MLTLEKGRPARCQGRLEKEIRTYDLLDRLGICYERVDHPVADTMEDCAAVDVLLGATICKNLFLCNRQQTQFYLLMLPGDKVFKTKELSRELGVSRLSFADEKYMEAFLDITPGSVSVLGLENDRENRVQLVIDRDVLAGEFFGCHPCINTASVRLRMQDLLERILPEIQHEPVFVTLSGEA